MLREGLRLVLAGVVLGLVAALFTSRLLGAVLHGVRPADALTLAITALLLAASGAAASILPALRASRTDPLRALRGA